MASTVLAQEQPTGAEAEGGPAAAAETTDQWVVEVASQVVEVDGNERRFDQYVTPPANPYLSRLMWQRWDAREPLSLDLDMRALGEPGPSADIWLAWRTALAFKSQLRRSAFYSDFAPTSDRTRRRDWQISGGTPAGTGTGFRWRADYSEGALRGLPTAGPQDWHIRDASLAAGWRTSGWAISPLYGRETFEFGAGNFFSGDTT